MAPAPVSRISSNISVSATQNTKENDASRVSAIELVAHHETRLYIWGRVSGGESLNNC